MKTIKNIFIFGVVVAMSLLLLGSCNNGGCLTGGELAPGTVQVQLVVPTAQIEKTATRATDGTAQENFVGKVQMLFWNVTKAKVERYIAIDPDDSPIIDASTLWNKTTGTLTLRGVNSTDKIVIYVMANGKGDELSSSFATQDAILEAIVEHSGAITNIEATPLPMSGISVETTFAADNSTKVTVDLRRTVAKVNITVLLGTHFSTAYPDLKLGQSTGTATTLDLINTVDRSYVFIKTPVTMPTDVKGGISPLLVTESGDTQAAMTWKATAYVFENPIADKDHSMKIALNIPYKDGTDAVITKNIYQVDINHAVADNRVVRNYIYNVTMTINGFAQDKFTSSIVVEPWSVENIDIPVAGDIIALNVTEIALLDENTTTFEVEYSGAAPLTITSDNGAKFKTLTIAPPTVTKAGKTVYVATVQALYAATATDDLGTLTISNGDARLERTVKVKYTPIIVTGLPTTRHNISDISPAVTLHNITASHPSEIAYGYKGKLEAKLVDATKTLTVTTTALNKDGSIISPMLWRVDVKAKNGRLIQTITFRYEPLTWAKADIVMSTHGDYHRYEIGWTGHDKALLFRANNTIGVYSLDSAPWNKVNGISCTFQENNVNATTETLNFDAYKTRYQSKEGDPCKLLPIKGSLSGGASDGKWRTPTKEEIVVTLGNGGGVEGQEIVGGNNIIGWKLAAYNLFFPWFISPTIPMGQRIPDGGFQVGLKGYRWGSTPEPIDKFAAILCDGNAVGARLNYEPKDMMFPVRCVRDFAGVEPTN